MPPFQHSPAYEEDSEERRDCRLLADGVKRLRKEALGNRGMWPRAGELKDAYLPDERSRSAGAGLYAGTRYELRVQESTIRNVWYDAVKEGSLAPFRHAIQLDGWGPEIEEWVKAIGSGKTLSAYMRTPAVEQAVDGIHLTLVELPEIREEDGAPRVRTLGDDRRAGIRPYWIPIRADHFDPIEVTAQGDLLVCAVYLSKSLGLEPGIPGLVKKKRRSVWRVYELRADGVWYYEHILKEPDPYAEIDEKQPGQWLPVRPLGSGALDRIPIVPAYGDWSMSAYRARPPYRDVADTQMGCWRKRSYKDDLGRRTARSRVFQSGVEVDVAGNPLKQFDGDLMWAEKEGADAKVVETSGQALEALRADLLDDEEYIHEACRSVRARRSTGEITATEIGLVGLMTSSYQESVVVGNTHSIRTLLELTEVMGGVPPSGGTVEWRHDTFSPVAESTLERIGGKGGAVERGQFSLEGWLRLEQRAGGLPEDFSFEDEQERLGKQSPPATEEVPQ